MVSQYNENHPEKERACGGLKMPSPSYPREGDKYHALLALSGFFAA